MVGSECFLIVRRSRAFDRVCRVCKISRLFFLHRVGKGRGDPQVTRRSGGIGRRAWFRSMYPQGCGGSSPFFGTKVPALIQKLLTAKSFKNSHGTPKTLSLLGQTRTTGEDARRFID